MKIFGIGTVVEDHVLQLGQYPPADHKIPVTSHWRQIGGPVPVALSVAAFFGASTSFCGRWGNDHAGANIKQTLTQRGVDLFASRAADEWESGFAHVWCDVEEGTRTIAYSRGSAPVPQPDEISMSHLAGYQVLHTDGWAAEAVIAAAETIRASGGQVVMDAGSVKPGLTLLLPLVDILVASSLFRRDYFGTPDPPDEQLLSLNVPHVITTDGERGCRWLTADHEIVQSAIDVDVVDSNGAGDVFCGALLFAITQGWPREQMLSFANTVAGLSCGNSGNYPPPQLDCVLQLMVE